MINRILQCLRSQSIGVLALFIALGGTSYAAFNLPSGSVGTSQLRDHSVTPAKLDTGARRPVKLGPTADVRYWARVSARGKVIAGSPGARAQMTGPSFYVITWAHRQLGTNCMPFASVAGVFGLAVVNRDPNRPFRIDVESFVGLGAEQPPSTYTVRPPAPVDVIVVCPS